MWASHRHTAAPATSRAEPKSAMVQAAERLSIDELRREADILLYELESLEVPGALLNKMKGLLGRGIKDAVQVTNARRRYAEIAHSARFILS